MKRIFSVVLIFILIFAFALTASANEPMVKFDYVSVFDSSRTESFLGGTAVSDENGLGDVLGSGGFSDNILEHNGSSITYLSDFEWQFKLKVDPEATGTVATAFCFHVSDESDTSSFEKRKNLFSVTLYGSDFKAEDKNLQVPYSLVVEYTNSKMGVMRPFKYDTSVKPWKTDSSSYIKLDDPSAEPIDISQYFTVNIKMTDREILVAVWASDDTSQKTYREVKVPMFANAVEISPSGDFVILSGENSGNINISDMQIKNYTLVRNESFASDTKPDLSGLGFDFKYVYIVLGALCGAVLIIIATALICKTIKTKKEAEHK